MQIDIKNQKTSTSSCHGMSLLSNLIFHCHPKLDEIFVDLSDNVSVSNGGGFFAQIKGATKWDLKPAAGYRQNIAWAGFQQPVILI